MVNLLGRHPYGLRRKLIGQRSVLCSALRFTFGMAFVFLCSIQPANAARFSSDYMMRVCGVNAQGQPLLKGGHIACQAYIAGILDYQNVLKSLGTAPSGVDFCVPEDATMYDIQTKVAHYLLNHRHQQGPFIAAPSVSLALKHAYPCP